MEKSELRLRRIVVDASIPVRGAGCCGMDEAAPLTATFEVDTDTWKCTGEVPGLVLAPTDWWEAQCKKVSERVQQMLV